jgi:hypothetical protein
MVHYTVYVPWLNNLTFSSVTNVNISTVFPTAPTAVANTDFNGVPSIKFAA